MWGREGPPQPNFPNLNHSLGRTINRFTTQPPYICSAQQKKKARKAQEWNGRGQKWKCVLTWSVNLGFSLSPSKAASFFEFEQKPVKSSPYFSHFFNSIQFNSNPFPHYSILLLPNLQLHFSITPNFTNPNFTSSLQFQSNQIHSHSSFTASRSVLFNSLPSNWCLKLNFGGKFFRVEFGSVG